jgi:hypothetical protein
MASDSKKTRQCKYLQLFLLADHCRLMTLRGFFYSVHNILDECFERTREQYTNHNGGGKRSKSSREIGRYYSTGVHILRHMYYGAIANTINHS